MDYKLQDLIDIPLLQSLQDKLNSIYSFPSAIIDREGKILTAVAWQDICTRFHRVHPECEKECIKSDQYINEHLHEASPAVSYQCPHGLIDNAAPIIIEGQHLGNFFTGQFFLEEPDLEFFRQQAKKYGFDETAYLEAVRKVPIWSKERLDQYLDFIKGFIEVIAGIGLNHLKEIEAFQTIQETRESLIAAKDQAEESKNKYSLLFDTMTEGVTLNEIIFNDSGEMVDYRIVETNKAFLDQTGLDSSMVIGNRATVLYQMSGDYIRDFWEQHRTRQHTAYTELKSPVDERIFYVATSPFVNDRFVTSFFDITGLKRAETLIKEQNDQLIIAKEKAEESDRLKSAFLANMSHEIRTPMNGILGFADLLKEPGLSDDQQKKYISIIEKSGLRMLNLINDIIDISKIESGQMEVLQSETLINRHLDDIFAFFKPEADQKGIRLSLKPPDQSDHLVIFTDADKLHAIINNLVKNAIKFTQQGSIEFGYESLDDHLRFFVKDSGVGIPEEQKEAIFERFRQGSELLTRNYEGAGLGLSIAKAFVEMLGGRIWLESEKEKGSTFYFTIPRKAGTVYPEGSLATPSAAEPSIPCDSLKIVFAEDDETSEEYISTIVRNFGKNLIIARNGAEAVEACRTHPDVDLVLMDVRMPVMDGYEATRQIRQFNSNVVIIAQTAYALKGDREKALEAGCNDHISKPVDKNLLTALIRNHCIRLTGS